MKKHSILLLLFSFIAFYATAQFNEGTRDVVLDDSEMSYRTQTIGGWGSKPRLNKDGEVVGNNPGSYLHKVFEEVFPDGITIGSENGYTLSFSDAQAITDFLPSGGTPRALESTESNPLGREVKNTLASQILGLTISVEIGRGGRLGYADLAKAVITDGSEMTVQEVLNIGNSILAGETMEEHSSESINEIITQINESFVDGEDKGAGFVERKF